MANTEQKSILKLECFHYIVADEHMKILVYSPPSESLSTHCSISFRPLMR
jgi:hypothetical protein